jgi:hypothetical protein
MTFPLVILNLIQDLEQGEELREINENDEKKDEAHYAYYRLKLSGRTPLLIIAIPQRALDVAPWHIFPLFFLFFQRPVHFAEHLLALFLLLIVVDRPIIESPVILLPRKIK